MLPDPLDVGPQRHGKAVNTRVKTCRIIKKNKIQPPQCLGHGAIFHPPAHDWRKSLMERCRVVDFSAHLAGRDRVRREHEDDRVGTANQNLETLPPILECINLLPIDEHLEAARLQPRFETIRKSHVLSRVGNEDFGGRLNFASGRGIRDHQRVSHKSSHPIGQNGKPFAMVGTFGFATKACRWAARRQSCQKVFRGRVGRVITVVVQTTPAILRDRSDNAKPRQARA